MLTTALLRLCVQKLCGHLGGSGENINDDIKALVKKGLLPQVQQSLDVVRVTGNNAVHGGVMDISDDQPTAVALFKLVNLIVEQMITAPKQAQAIFSSLPAADLAKIGKRDGS